MEKSLKSSEWVILSSFFLIFCFLVLCSRMKVYKLCCAAPVEWTREEDLILVTVEGAVRNPGTYSVLPGTSLQKIIKKSRPDKDADLMQIDLNQRIEEPVHLVIEKKKEILIWITRKGEEPFSLKLPRGSRFFDLKSKIPLDETLDPILFKKRRLLRDGEKISL